MKLVRARHSNHNLCEVPDRHLGDLGLEAFTQEGVAFQCYAAKEPLDVNSLYENQRGKLTEDVGKLQKYAKDLAELLGEVVIEKYVFMIHRHDSRKLVKHAQAKALEVRAWNLPFISSNFTITIETDENYEVERNLIWAIPEQLVNMESVPEEVKIDWESNNPRLLDEARRKLGNLDLKDKRLTKYLNKLLDEYLVGQNTLQQIRNRFPDYWDSVTRTQSSKENRLTLEYPPGSTSASGDVVAIVIDLEKEIMQSAPSISEQIARTLAWATIADWIMRCPLDFEDPE